MPLDPNIMVNALKNLSAGTEPESAEAWTNMIIDYLKTATGIIPSGFTPVVVQAVRLVLDGPTGWEVPLNPDPPIKDGMSVPGAGIAIIQSAFVAVWGQMAAAPPTFFTGATVITPPPGLTAISADLNAQIPTNKLLDGSGITPSTGDLEQDKELAVQNLVLGVLTPSTGFHIRNQGGTYTIPGTPPVVTPIV